MPPKPLPLSLSQEEILALVARSRTGSPPDTWIEDLHHRGTRMLAFGTLPRTPRLVVELTAREHPLMARRIIDYGLFLQSPWNWKSQERIYQLTIDDPRIITHRDKTTKVVIYGSHELIGETTVRRLDLDESTFERGLAEFCKAINLVIDGPIDDPFSLRLR